MLEIKTNELKTRKKALIDGHIYTVRKISNLERLDYSQGIRRLMKLSEIEKSGTKMTEKQTDEVNTLAKNMFKIFMDLFDDGGDQSKTKELFSQLSDEEIGVIIDKIFEEKEEAREDGKAKNS